MALPARSNPNPASQPPANTGQSTLRLKKGDILFAEGDTSRAMYFLKTGMIRLYKKKGDAVIELDTVHTGQVLGELAFLDGNPRSASGEALTDCELLEISGPTFQQILVKMPDWLKILLKTVVGRLRTASTRIRQLESASTAYDYSEKDGKRSPHYVYLSTADVLKIASALLLVSSRNGAEIRIGLLQRYANQIMGVPIAKITTFMDIMTDTDIVSMDDSQGTPKITLKDDEFLEQLITYINEENLVEPSKRHDLSGRGFLIMSLIAKHLVKYTRDEITGHTVINLAEIKAVESALTGKDPFRMEEFQQLVKFGYASNLTIKSNSEIYSSVNAEGFALSHRLQKVILAINVVNEQKRNSGGK